MRSLRNACFSGMLILLLLGIAFKIMHWPGSNSLLYIGAILAIIYVVLLVIKR